MCPHWLSSCQGGAPQRASAGQPSLPAASQHQIRTLLSSIPIHRPEQGSERVSYPSQVTQPWAGYNLRETMGQALAPTAPAWTQAQRTEGQGVPESPSHSLSIPSAQKQSGLGTALVLKHCPLKGGPPGSPLQSSRPKCQGPRLPDTSVFPPPQPAEILTHRAQLPKPEILTRKARGRSREGPAPSKHGTQGKPR